MFIKNLTLENFKRHEHLSVEFTESSNIIVGNNYAGKSTLLHAILVGLWGNSAAPGKTPDLIRRGAKNFKVCLELSNGLYIERTVKNSSISKGVGQEPYVQGHSEVNVEVEKLMEIDKASFLKLFTSMQGSPQQLLAMEGVQLQRFIESCFGLELMDKVIAKFKSLSSSTEAVVNHLRNEQILSEDQVAEINRDIVEADTMIETTLKPQLEKAEEISEFAKDLVAKLKIDIEQATAFNQAHDKYQKALKDALDNPPVNYVENGDEETLDAEIKACENKQSLVRAHESLQTQIDRQKRSLQELLDTRPEGEVKELLPVEEFNEALLKAREDANAAKRTLAEMNEALVNGTCKTCKRPFGETVPYTPEEVKQQKIYVTML